jgi:hypothetical protein
MKSVTGTSLYCLFLLLLSDREYLLVSLMKSVTYKLVSVTDFIKDTSRYSLSLSSNRSRQYKLVPVTHFIKDTSDREYLLVSLMKSVTGTSL